MLDPQDEKSRQVVWQWWIDLVKSLASKSPVMGSIPATVIKVNEEARMAYGWASVISEGGQPVEDHQGDMIEPDELVTATTNFMADARVAKAMHDGDGIGEVLHSFPLTQEFAKALGIESKREGWIVGVKVHSDDVWAKVKSGELRAFSIAGFGQFREEAAQE